MYHCDNNQNNQTCCDANGFLVIPVEDVGLQRMLWFEKGFREAATE